MIYIGKFKGEFNPNYLGSGIVLNRAINKYGKNSFTTRLIDQAKDREELNKIEKAYIFIYRTKYGKQRLYNVSAGGDGGATMTGKKHTAKSIEKMKKNHAGGREKGYHITKEHKGKIGLANKGNLGPFRNKKHVIGTRKKMSSTAQRKDVIKKRCTKERNKKVSNSLRGKPSGMLGKTAYNKGKTNKELFGELKAEEIRQKTSKKLKKGFKKGRVPWNKGLTKETNIRVQETGKKISNRKG